MLVFSSLLLFIINLPRLRRGLNRKNIMKKYIGILLVFVFIISFGLFNISRAQEADPIPLATDTLPGDDVTPPADSTPPTDVTPPVDAPSDVTPPADTTPPTDAPQDVTPSADVPPTPVPTLSTDLPDYEPGDTANIFGNFFPSLQNFVLRIFGNSEVGNHYTDTSFTVNSDNAGSFSYAYLLDNMYRPLYTVTASTLDGEQIASTTFTDAAGAGVDVYSQCANDDGDGYTGNPGVCDWTNGDLNGSNSTYTEEDSTVQRLVLSGLSNGAHTVVIEYQTTKGGKHAYDFLTNDTASETWVTDADLCSGPVTTAMPSCTSLSSNLSPAIPHDPLNTLGTPDGNQHFKIKNGTITSFGTPTLVNGSYGADSLTDIAVNFTVNTSTCADASGGKCPVFITWGAHVSSQADWGAGTSAVNINGSPYHVKVVELDGGSTGNRDNQMAASAIVIPNTITIHKVTDPSTDTTTSFTYTTTGTGFSGFNLTGGTSNTQNVTPGNYSITESTLSGWANTALTCTATGTGTSATPNVGTRSVSITVGSAGGGVVDCIYTNTLQQAHLTLVKTVTNDNGGTAVATAWTLNGSGPTPISGVTGSGAVTNAAVNAGTYALSETSGPSGYTAGSWSCTGGTQNGSNITLAAGQSATCTINNNDNPAHLIVIKHVINDNGGTATASNFTMTIGGVTAVGGNSFAGAENPGTDKTLSSLGAYTVTEGAMAGYTQTSASADCSGTIAQGETKTCTITNDDIAPTLTLVKTVINDNGGTAVTTDFQGMIDSGNVSWTVAQTTTAGAHTASETNLSGYTAGNWGGDCAANGTITLSLAQNATCTITNNDQPAHLIVIKHVINDNGGTALANTFTTTISGVTTGTPVAAGVESPGVNNTLTTVGAYTVDEGAHTGYDKTLSADCSGTIALGETKTCTITNDDIQPKLTLTKIVVNDNGGNAVVSDFPLFVNATGVTSGVQNNFNAGSYTASETNLTGYTAGSWTGDCATNGSVTLNLGDVKACTITNNDQPAHIILNKVVINNNGGTAGINDFGLTVGGNAVNSGVNSSVNSNQAIALNEAGLAGYNFVSLTGDAKCPAILGGTVTLDEGETVTCTITNDDIAPILHLRKVVINDNGGSATVADFTLTANGTGTNDISGTSPVDSGAGLLADTFALSETTMSGYTPSAWSCVGGTQNGANITLGLGQEATCTITNDDQQAYITVVKVVINNNGGTAQPDDFALTLEGNATTSGTPVPVNPGTYTSGETLFSGYAFEGFSGDCDQNGDTTVALGQSKTCTITNDDIQPKLTLIKHVVNDNGGTKVVSDFPLFVNATGVVSGVQNGFDAGSYTASETSQTGYAASSWSGDCSANGSVTLGIGDVKTCEITNDDISPKLTVTKIVINDNGGTKVVSDFPLFVNATGVVSGVQNNFNAGSYTVSETTDSGYSSVISGDCAPNGAVTLGLADVKACTITNDDIPAHLIVIKHVINDNGGTAVAGAFTMNIGGVTATGGNSFAGAENPGTTKIVTPGAYTVTESSLTGYTQASASTDCAGTIALGQTKTCTITNDDQPAHLIVIKHVINDDGDVAVAGDFTMHLTGTNLSTNNFAGNESGVNVTLNAGAYTADEVSSAGYVKTMSADCSGTIANGETKTCTITNNDLPHATRTIGFWQTHTTYTSGVFAGINPLTIGTHVIDSTSKLFAGFYASIPKTTTGAQRTALDKARIQMLQQWLGAELNCKAFTCSAGTATMLANAAAAWAGTNTALIQSFASQLDAYNNSNDAIAISGQGSATPKTSQSLANSSLAFWNILP